MAAAAMEWRGMPLGPGVSILKVHPSGLAALLKPEGVLSHPNRGADRTRSLLTADYDGKQQCFKWADAAGVAHCVWLLHRLDGATSGVILIAGDEVVAAAVRAAFENRCVRKRYVAAVFGHTREKHSIWKDAMQVKRQGGVVRAASGTIAAQTDVRCLRLIPGPPAMALIELEPHTGRTHQLRHQCARRHLPIIGDQNYGNFKLNRDFARRTGVDRLLLHAVSIELEFTASGGGVRFSAEAPLPDAFAAVARTR